MSQTLWTILTVVAAAGLCLCLYVMHIRLGASLKAIDKDFRMLDMRFRYTPDEVYACLDGVGERGQALLKRFWLVDFGFIACLWFIMVAVGRNTVHIEALRAAMLIAASLRAVLDIAENLFLLRISARYPARRMDGMARVSSLATSVKFIALGLWIAGLFVALFISALKMGR